MLNAMNYKPLVGGIFCDLEKAFDCVNDIPLSQMKFYGISDKDLTLSYLDNRYCRTAICNEARTVIKFQTGLK